MEDEHSALHVFLSTAAFAVGGALLAVLLTFMPTAEMQQRPWAAAVLIVVMPVWLVLGLFFQGLSKRGYEIYKVNRVLLAVNLALVPLTGVALALTFTLFRPIWGVALIIGYVTAAGLSVKIATMFAKL
jgi:hypothetical protein